MACVIAPAAPAEPARASAAPDAPRTPRGVRVPAVIQTFAAPVVIRARPSGTARAVAILRPLRGDGGPAVVLAIGRRTDRHSRLWYRVRVARRPNGTTGWLLASRVDAKPLRTRVRVDLSARTLTVRRGRWLMLRARVAVGRAGMETPVGQFFVTARFRPTLDYLGAFAFETSAFSRLTDWPGGGIVGIHGTNQPELLGQAVSHGCVRVANRTIRRMRELVELGTPIEIRA